MFFSLLFLVILVGLVIGMMASCGDDDDDDDDADDDADDDDDTDDDDTDDDDTDDDDDDDDFDFGDWWPPDPGTSFLYAVTEWTLDEFEFTATIIGDDLFEGETYTKLEFGDLFKATSIGVEVWYDLTTPGKAGFAGANMFWSDASLGSFIMDDPVYLTINPIVDDPISDTATGIFTEPVNGDVPLTMVVTTTTLDLDTSVTVPYGTVDNCLKIKVDIDEDFAHTWVDRLQSSELYIHRDLGLVKVSGDFLFGFHVELKEVLTDK